MVFYKENGGLVFLYGALLTKVILHVRLGELRQGLVMMVDISYHPFHGVRCLPTHLQCAHNEDKLYTYFYDLCTVYTHGIHCYICLLTYMHCLVGAKEAFE